MIEELKNEEEIDRFEANFLEEYSRKLKDLQDANEKIEELRKKVEGEEKEVNDLKEKQKKESEELASSSLLKSHSNSSNFNALLPSIDDAADYLEKENADLRIQHENARQEIEDFIEERKGTELRVINVLQAQEQLDLERRSLLKQLNEMAISKSKEISQIEKEIEELNMKIKGEREKLHETEKEIVEAQDERDHMSSDTMRISSNLFEEMRKKDLENKKEKEQMKDISRKLENLRLAKDGLMIGVKTELEDLQKQMSEQMQLILQLCVKREIIITAEKEEKKMKSTFKAKQN
eukprot:MONOS_384.1-p1 / transcript=MONOS_384.1 / gene=MONOS_384 / organism=Monocercomonoides_exilis_PA203 / gene_product=unspecified product / transcript_product=unspecified product / location=Mono_scaffold00006:152948-154102(-) / protein_length=293 / sequence_SO=supercontig / SO=protein_coding / is_pseudo=false